MLERVEGEWLLHDIIVIGQGETTLNLKREDLGWMLRRNCLLRGW